jgi:Dolichyl-phosphate-mannose-protein mannosyltransferase
MTPPLLPPVVLGLVNAPGRISGLLKGVDHPKRFPRRAPSTSKYGLTLNGTDESSYGAAIRASLRYPTPARMVLVIIASATVLRVLISIMFGLGIDESYMVAMGRTLQLSYFDHPPLSWWLSWGASHLFGSEMPVVARLPFIALFALSTWLMYRLTAILFSRKAGVWTAIVFNISPIFGVTSASWVLPDGPLITALLGFMICLARATSPEIRRSWAWWLGTGLCGGLALLSKYTAILVLFGAAMAMLTHPVQRRWLLRPQPWLAAAVAAALFSPVIVWNAEHHWCSVAFQGGRALGSTWHPFAPLTVLGGEALYLLPWIWLPLMTTLAAAWRRGRADWSSWALACSGTPPVVLFALVAIWSHGHVLFHWAAPGYLVLFPLLGAGLARWAKTYGRALRRVAAASGVHQPEPCPRWVAEMDRGRPHSGEYRPRCLVHDRSAPYPASGGLAGHARHPRRLHAQTGWILRPEPGHGRPTAATASFLLCLTRASGPPVLDCQRVQGTVGHRLALAAMRRRS